MLFYRRVNNDVIFRGNSFIKHLPIKFPLCPVSAAAAAATATAIPVRANIPAKLEASQRQDASTQQSIAQMPPVHKMTGQKEASCFSVQTCRRPQLESTSSKDTGQGMEETKILFFKKSSFCLLSFYIILQIHSVL